MLDMNTIQVIKLYSDYAIFSRGYRILGYGMIIFSLVTWFIMNKKYTKMGKELEGIFATAITIIIINFISLYFLTADINYCDMVTKVIPTDKLTIEQMQQSDKFIKKDGDYYYVATIQRSVNESDEAFYSRINQTKSQVKEDFNTTLNEIWFKEESVSK